MIPSLKVVPSDNLKSRKSSGKADTFTLPTRLISIIYGVSPFSFSSNGARFSVFHFLYSTVLIFSTSLARIFLTPPEPQVSFFFQVLHYKQMLMPASCIISYVFIIVKVKKFIKYFEETLILRKYFDFIQRKRLFYFQIFLIFTAFACFIFVNALTYFLKPDLYEGAYFIPGLLDFHLSVTLWVLKLQFFICMISLWNILQYLRRRITNLQRISSSVNTITSAVDISSIPILFEKLVTLAENLNDCYGVTLGVASLLTALNCITTAYIHFTGIEKESGPFLLAWLIIDFAQQWMILTATEIFMSELRKIPIAVHQSMRVIQNKLLVKQLKQFSTYLVHRKVKFTICGLVSLDYTLLFTIAGAVTTYMIVLVQFQKTENTTKH